MKNNLRILKFFIENKDKKFTIKKVAEILKTNYRIVHEEISSLEKDRLIRIEKQGNSKICQFSYIYSSKIVEVEEIRKHELFKNKDIRLIYKRIKEITNPFFIFLVFGSFANRTNTKNSDIDLCLITDDKKVRQYIQTMLSITPLNIHLQDFTSHDFMQMLKSKEVNVGNEIVKNNIILYGIEGFYEMVNNVKQ